MNVSSLTNQKYLQKYYIKINNFISLNFRYFCQNILNGCTTYRRLLQKLISSFVSIDEDPIVGVTRSAHRARLRRVVVPCSITTSPHSRTATCRSDGQLEQSRQQHIVRDRRRRAIDSAALVGVLVPAVAVLQATDHRAQSATAARAGPTTAAAQGHRKRIHAARGRHHKR